MKEVLVRFRILERLEVKRIYKMRLPATNERGEDVIALELKTIPESGETLETTSRINYEEREPGENRRGDLKNYRRKESERSSNSSPRIVGRLREKYSNPDRFEYNTDVQIIGSFVDEKEGKARQRLV